MDNHVNKTSEVHLGVLIDVSGSMKSVFEKFDKPSNLGQMGLDQTRFQFVIDQLRILAQDETKADSLIFAIAFGLDYKEYDICDLLDVLLHLGDKSEVEEKEIHVLRSRSSLVDIMKEKSSLVAAVSRPLYRIFSKRTGLIQILEVYCQYYSRSQIYDDVTEELANKFLNACSWNYEIFEKLLRELPKQIIHGPLGPVSFFVNISPLRLLAISQAVDQSSSYGQRKFADKEIQNQVRLSIEKLKELSNVNMSIQIKKEIKSFNQKKIFDFFNGKNQQDFKELVKSVECIIGGGTPMCKSLQSSIYQFKWSGCKHKILILFSDGAAGDDDPIPLANQLKQNGVTIVSCYLTSENIQNPRQLYNEEQKEWDTGARTMFNISSVISNKEKPLRILARLRNWSLTATGQSNLFVQANNPDIIDEFVQQLGRIRSSNDCLFDSLGKVNLDDYIQSSQNFKPVNQEGPTCWANSVSACFQFAMKRIYRREGGYPPFEEIRDNLFKIFGKDKGQNTLQVIQATCSQYRLRSQTIKIDSVKHILNQGRPVAARYSLGKQQWFNFIKFFSKDYRQWFNVLGDNPDRVLTSQIINTPRSPQLIDQVTDSGHAVVLMSYDTKGLTFLNSWGPSWGNGGFFTIESENVLEKMEFYDIYWGRGDLTESEKKFYLEDQALIMKQEATKLGFIVDNHNYKCPLCGQESPVKDYSGNISQATCPKCKKFFKPPPIGDYLISSLYWDDQ